MFTNKALQYEYAIWGTPSDILKLRDPVPKHRLPKHKTGIAKARRAATKLRNKRKLR